MQQVKADALAAEHGVQGACRAVPMCYDTTLIFLEYEIVDMGRRSMNVDVAVMR
jgi:hypothetical protein